MRNISLIEYVQCLKRKTINTTNDISAVHRWQQKFVLVFNVQKKQTQKAVKHTEQTSRDLLHAGGRVISKPWRPMRKARCLVSGSSSNTVHRNDTFANALPAKVVTAAFLDFSPVPVQNTVIHLIIIICRLLLQKPDMQCTKPSMTQLVKSEKQRHITLIQSCNCSGAFVSQTKWAYRLHAVG